LEWVAELHSSNGSVSDEDPFGRDGNDNGEDPFGRNGNDNGEDPFGRNGNDNSENPFGGNGINRGARRGGCGSIPTRLSLARNCTRYFEGPSTANPLLP
jgi:hypothetical protein